MMAVEIAINEENLAYYSCNNACIRVYQWKIISTNMHRYDRTLEHLHQNVDYIRQFLASRYFRGQFCRQRPR